LFALPEREFGTLKTFDMVAVARISSRVELQGIRLLELVFTTKKIVAYGSPLEPSIEPDCVPLPSEKGFINVSCGFTFMIRSTGEEVAESKFKYLIQYKLNGEEVPAEQDVIAFSAVNGAYHAWPFVRELVFNLTARMGFQPFTLPVLSFHPPKPKTDEPTPAPEIPVQKQE
jgi:hypothetical protein